MTDYEQPDFYRFNEDSIKLANYVVEKVSGLKSILDLGAGCGVLGLELAHRLGIKDLTLLETQTDFIPFLQKNAHSLHEAKIIHSSFGHFAPERSYDCIVSNPPYYDPKRGERSLDPRRDIARSFIQDNWKIFLELIDRCLSNEGKAFIVLRNDKLVLDQVLRSCPRTLVIKKQMEGKLVFLELSRLNVD